MSNLQTRNNFQPKSRDQVDDVTNQLFMSKDIRSVNLNFKPCQKVEKIETPDFFLEKLG